MTRKEKLFMAAWWVVVLSGTFALFFNCQRALDEEEAAVATCGAAVQLCVNTDGARCSRVESLCVSGAGRESDYPVDSQKAGK